VTESTTVSVERLMRRIEEEARAARRARLLARGGADAYGDPELFAEVERVLARAADPREADALLLPQLLSDDQSWVLSTQLHLTSHRGFLGRVIVAVKRRVLLPIVRWLYEYSLENFRRQQRVNRILFGCIEELAIENALLKRELASWEEGGAAESGAPGPNHGRGAPPGSA
jgi:hypothetical protein